MKMEVNKKVEGSVLTVVPEGRIDTVTAPVLQSEIDASIDGITELYFDFAKVEYISSAGLRVLLSAQKVMKKQGKMVIINVSDSIAQIFKITGFYDILTIE